MKWIHMFLVGAALAAPMTAATINIEFQAADQFATPGSTIVYSAAVANLTMSPIDLGAADVSVGGNAIADPTPFFNGPATIPANGTTGVFDIFALTIPGPTPSGSVFPGILTITDLNGATLGTAAFTVHAVPEPSGLFLVGALLIAVARRRLGT